MLTQSLVFSLGEKDNELSMNPQDATDASAVLQCYAERLVALRADNLDSIGELLAENVEFEDPFNHSYRRQDYQQIMADMFASLSDVSFDVQRVDPIPNGGYLVWTFSAYSKITGTIQTEGVSLILLNEQNKIRLHRDFWDGSAVMTGIPVLGTVIRQVKKRAAAVVSNV